MNAEKFNTLKRKTEKHTKNISANRQRLTKAGRIDYPFSQLEKFGVRNITDFKRELKKVNAKISGLSVFGRRIIRQAEILLKQEGEEISVYQAWLALIKNQENFGENKN